MTTVMISDLTLDQQRFNLSHQFQFPSLYHLTQACNLSFEQQNQFVPVSAAPAASIHTKKKKKKKKNTQWVMRLRLCGPLQDAKSKTLSIKANIWIGL